jgi:DNA-binding NtrC family response regulator
VEQEIEKTTSTGPPAEATRDTELVVATWHEEPSAELGGTLINHALVATSCFRKEESKGYYNRLLRELLCIFRGERAFLFELRGDPCEAPDLGNCMASIDLDGDPVSLPERKIPRKRLLQCAETKEPFFRHWRQGTSEADRHSCLLILPAPSRERCVALVVVENRLQDLVLSAEALRTALLYCQSLAGYLDLVNVLRENESLWEDLSRTRFTGEATGVAEPSRARTRSPAGRRRKREGLRGDYSMIVGSSPKMLEILQVIDRISGSNAPVLINGESGTGKELIAVAVHANSPRKDKIFVSENCAAITETLLESELFGYVRGAFTGANKDHKGLFEQAIGGTLFLDEVGDMSPSMQKKLLRVLQEGVIRRVGAKEFTTVNVRIISATNKDLLSECRAGRFREDLYYRLNVINLRLPPLRERREDIPSLVEYILEELSRETGAVKSFHLAAMEKLVQYSWPGNVRELQNEVKRLFALAEGDIIQTRDLSEHLIRGEAGDASLGQWYHRLSHMTLKEAREHLEQEMIRRALAETGGNKSLVAKTLQIPKTSLYNKIHKYKL